MRHRHFLHSIVHKCSENARAGHQLEHEGADQILHVPSSASGYDDNKGTFWGFTAPYTELWVILFWVFYFRLWGFIRIPWNSPFDWQLSSLKWLSQPPAMLELDFDLDLVTWAPVFILLTIKDTGKSKLGNYKNSVEHCRFSYEKTEIPVLVIWGHIQCALKCFTRTLGTHENFSVQTRITSSEHFFILLDQLLNIP